jgi:hypothetical protein
MRRGSRASGASCVKDHRLELGEGHRRHVVDESRQLLDVDVRHQVGPGREELPELHISGAELLERMAELARRLGRRGPLAGHADLTQNAEQPASPRDLPDLESPSQSFASHTHVRILSGPCENTRGMRLLRVTGLPPRNPVSSVARLRVLQGARPPINPLRTGAPSKLPVLGSDFED